MNKDKFIKWIDGLSEEEYNYWEARQSGIIQSRKDRRKSRKKKQANDRIKNEPSESDRMVDRFFGF